MLLLDTKHRVLRTVVLSVGTLDASIVHPREVFGAAATAGAAALVLFHNHPSGDPKPSQDDVELTRRLAAAGILMGITRDAVMRIAADLGYQIETGPLDLSTADGRTLALGAFARSPGGA